MIVMGGAKDRRRGFALGLFGCLMAGALALGAGSVFAEAAETVSKPAATSSTGEAAPANKPAQATSTKKKASAAKTTAKAKAKKKISRKKTSTKVAKTKHPLPPPPKPTALASATTPRATTPGAKIEPPRRVDVSADLDEGLAEVLPTGSVSTGLEPKPAPTPPADIPVVVETKPAAISAPSTSDANAAPAAPAEPQIAATPPAPAVTLSEESIRIHFAPGAADLPESAETAVGEITALMSREPSLRLQLLAYAAGTKETASQSRRLSLNRALAVRGALIDAGVRSTRIDVRALGSQTEETPPDRVDVLVMQRSGG